MKSDFTGVKFLALHMLDVRHSTEALKMNKILHENVFYKFYDGFKYEDDKIFFTDDVPQELYQINSGADRLDVSVCAIVGENGSGKSTIVDFIIRILNNLSVFLFGEDYHSFKAEHLHFIDNVNAELFLYVEGKIFSIGSEKEKVYIKIYENDENDNSYEFIESRVISGTLDAKEICPEHSQYLDILQDLCYTIVVNYSLHSFNSLNYMDENTALEKEYKIRLNGKIRGYNKIARRELLQYKNQGDVYKYWGAFNWLQGLFHKNDGYQIPIVITPMRETGGVNLQKEYQLSKERLMSLVLKNDDTGQRIFSAINGKLLVQGFYLNVNSVQKKKYSNIYFRLLEYLPQLQKGGCAELCYVVRQAVLGIFHLDDEEAERNYSGDTLNYIWSYIVFKFIKIIFTYSMYSTLRKVFLDIRNGVNSDNLSDIKMSVYDISLNHSHITRKLFRTINYLKYNHIGRKKKFVIDTWRKELESIIENENMKEWQIDELLPPPIFDVSFILYDVHDTKFEKPINLNSLSSGEKQVTYTLTNIFYHLSNLDSKNESGSEYLPFHYEQSYPDGENSTIIKYKYATLIFDEMELYFHPEMQRTFLADLMEGLKQLKLKYLKGVQIMIVTHSPFVLSDIPNSHTLFLQKDGYPHEIDDMMTFGANIHSILRHSFFLHSGSMGEYAQKAISSMIQDFNLLDYCQERDKINSGKCSEEEKKRAIEKLNDENYRMLKLLPDNTKSLVDSSNYVQIKQAVLNKMDYYQRLLPLIQNPIISTTLKNELIKNCGYVDSKKEC